jgi:succinate dehydrogenase/fumarate reductase flavoprotein subunit
MTSDPAAPLAPRRLRDVRAFQAEADVVVVGQGAAGAAAALEAACAGVRTLVLERAGRGGGAAALSTGLVYLGGGTAVQRACGFADSVAEMQAYVRLAAGAGADPERVRLYCEGSVGHFEWLRSLGVEFKASFVADRVTHPLTDDGLFVSGNEEAHPFAERVRPVPRGHKPARPGEAGGYLMEALLRGGEGAGARCLPDCRAERLVQDPDGRVVGVVARRAGEEIAVGARRAVLLATGGFVMNRPLLEAWAPGLRHVNLPTGTPGDDGSGIRMGVGAGAALENLAEGCLLTAFYPPSAHLKGILVDAQGARFVNEDAYLARTSDAIAACAGARAFLVVDHELYGRTPGRHPLAAVEASVAELERALGMPEASLSRTVERYNAAARRGEDPEQHKARAWLRPLAAPPFAALDLSPAASLWGGFTLGGLRTRAGGEVLRADGSPVPGLFAAGRCTAGLCREGRAYASGLSIGEATFFGRLAGRGAAAAPRGGA